MTGKGRKADRLLDALLMYPTIKEAARAAQMSERSAYDHLREPDFKERYQTARDDVFRGVTNHLRAEMGVAVAVISGIMKNAENKPQERLNAAKLILEHGQRYVETQEILDRLKALEEAREDAQGGG